MTAWLKDPVTLWVGASCSKSLINLYVILQDQVIKRSCDFMEGSSSLHVTTLPGLVVIGILVVEICFYHVTSRDYTFKGLCDL